MKRLWIALGLLALLLLLTICHTHSLQHFTNHLTGQLEEAETLVQQEQWEQARQLTQSALDTWNRQDIRLHVLLRHADTDQIHAGFQEVLALLNSREYGEYAAANARLISQLHLLSEAEQLNLKNIL